MLPLPPLKGLQETIKFILPCIAELTGAVSVMIRPTEDDEVIAYRSSGEFINPYESNFPKNRVYIPLKNGGWLMLYDPKNIIDKDIIDQYCSQAIENAKAYDNIQGRSLTDALTGLPNRAALKAQLDREIRRCSMFCVLFIDLNNFKKVNDTYGHITGDDVLKHVASEIKQVIRSSDFLARYGGDEFVAVLPESTKDEGEKVASRIQKKVIKTEKGINVTLSIGLAVFPFDGATPEELIEKADLRMYHNKQRRFLTNG